MVDDEGEEIDKVEIARMVVWMVRLSDALDNGVSFFDIFDAHSDWLASYFDPLGSHTDTFDGCYDMFVIQDLAVKPDYRGGQIGRMFIERACQVFGRNCEFALCQPRARVSNDFIPRSWRRTKLSDDAMCRYFEAAGFRSVEGADVYRMNLMQRGPLPTG